MIKDEVVLITGTAGGIGRATAIAAARELARLALADLNLEGAQFDETIPLCHLGQPENVAEMVVWLLSDRAKYVTGRLPRMDGGIMAG